MSPPIPPDQSSPTSTGQSSTPTPPGQQWLSSLEKRYLLHPSLVNRQGDLRYWLGIVLYIITILLIISRTAIGAFWPQVGLSLANFLNVYGHGGQIISAAGVLFYTLILFLQIQLMR